MTVADGAPGQRSAIATPDEARQIFSTPRRDRYDLIIIGGGSAGLSAASFAAALGSRVALLERDRLGGECLYTGCVASKALLRVARAAATIRNAAALGLATQLAPVDLGAVTDTVRRAIDAVYAESDAPEHFVKLGVDVVIGEPRFISPKALTITGKTLSAKGFLIATGSRPTVPDVPGLREAGFLTNETVFARPVLPESLAVIGGGPVGVELGQAFARLGTRVTIVERAERLIPNDEPEASAALTRRLEADGATVMTRAAITGVTMRDGRKVIAVESPEGAGELAVEEMLVAAGREPRIEGLDLEAAGVAYGPRTGIAVDEHLRSRSNRRVYAAGDVIGGALYTHAAARQARIAVQNILLPIAPTYDERVLPWATFTEPEIGHVGLTEAQARGERAGDEVRVVTLPMAAVDRAVTDGETEGFIKLLATPKGELLGATIAGASAGELINELALAMEHGLTLGQIASTTHVYPTIGLGLQQAAGQFALERTASSHLVKLLRRLV